jgi:hypothetical protein
VAENSSGWTAVFWIVITLILADHLFDIPGLIARHHQGHLGRILGPWFTWMMAITSAAFSAYFAVVHTRNWLRLRSAAVK